MIGQGGLKACARMPFSPPTPPVRALTACCSGQLLGRENRPGRRCRRPSRRGGEGNSSRRWDDDDDLRIEGSEDEELLEDSSMLEIFFRAAHEQHDSVGETSKSFQRGFEKGETREIWRFLQRSSFFASPSRFYFLRKLIATR